MVLWGAPGRPHRPSRMLEVWQQWANDVRGEALDCGLVVRGGLTVANSLYNYSLYPGLPRTYGLTVRVKL